MKKVWRVCTIGMLMASLAVLFMGVAQALTNSGGGSWQYNRIITINNNGSALTNYQVLVNLTGSNFPANAQISGADIRFTDVNGTELNYWIESFDRANRTAKIWVKVADIQTSTFITMYYGNPSAASASNGAATFDLFDDFLGTSLDTSKWSLSGSVTVNNGYVSITNGGSALTSLTSLGNVDIVFVTRSAVSDNTKFFIGLGDSNAAHPNNGAFYQIGWDRGGGWYDWEMWTSNNGAYSRFDMGSPSPTANVWEKIEIKRLPGSIAYYLNDVWKVTHTNVSTVSMPFQISTKWGNTLQNSQPNDVDYVRVRKYASPEPSIMIGNEMPNATKKFSFVQLTDVHIGPDPLLCGFGDSESLPCLLSFITSIDRFKAVSDDIISRKPDFVLVTGDLVEWNSAFQYTAFNTLISKFKENNITVYIVPGNHDRRGEDIPTWNYPITNPFFPNNDLTNYKKYIVDGYNYDIRDNIFDQSGYRFIGLDSGNDLNIPEFPKYIDPKQIKEYITKLYNFKLYNYLIYPNGSGLSKKQIDLTSNYALDGKTIIFMHHPAVDDSCLDNSCNVITENRDLFVALAKDKHVKLALTGHTHESKFFDSNEKVSNTFNRYGTVTGTIPINSINTFINVNLVRSPLFIQTRSATKDEDTLHGYLAVNVGGMSIFKEEMSLVDVKMIGSTSAPVTILYLYSPADLHAYDEFGRHTGLNATGGIENSIPDSYYFEEYKTGNITLPAFTLLYNTTLNYSYEIVSNFSRENITTDQATFNFTIEQKTQGAITTIKYNNVSINRNSKAYLQINTTQTNYTMQIDLNNDGIIDTTKQPDTIETDYAPTATILSPTDGSTWDQGQPVTFNGSGFDREDGTLSKLTWISDRDDVIGHGNFTTANLSAGVHNVILLVNDSVGQVNTSNIVLTVRDTAPPVLDIEYPPENKIFNKQNIAVIGFAYDDSDISKVTVNGIEAGKENWNAIVTLNEGKNIINVTATDNNGFRTISNRTVYYNSSLANDTEPPAVITNLTHKTGLDASGRAWINWTWDNPEDQDFSYVMIYLDNIFMENTSRPYFSINGLSNDANYNISILSADVVDNINYTEVKETVKTLPPDSTPPVTAIALSGILGSNDWYTSDVQINLAAADNEAGTGVAVTEFSFDDINWSTYTAPFNISNEGITAVFYRSTDNAGNVESTRHKSIKIDKTQPNISISTVVDGSHYNSNVTPVISIIDTNLNNQTVMLNGTPFTSDNLVSAEGNYTLLVSADDSAGNTASMIVNFVIDKTPPEGAISFNASSKDIKVYSNENGSEINYIILSSKKDRDNDKKLDDEKENGWELRRYTLKDLASNLFELVLMHKKEGNEVKVKVITMQYSGGSIIDAAMNEIQVSYSTGKNSSLRELEQKVDVKKQLDAEAKYSFKENKTEIKVKLEGQKEQKLTRAGIVIFELISERGGLNLTLKDT